MKSVRRCFISLILFAASAFLLQASPLYEKILLSEHDELVAMASLRGIDTSLSDNELRSRILSHEGFEVSEEKLAEQEDGKYTINIVSADNFETISDSKLLFTGNVEIAFLMEGSEKTRSISSKNLIVDSKAKSITAFGEVRFKDESLDKGLGNMNAEIVTFLWEDGDLVVSGGTTFTERENSEGSKITFYTYGDTLVYKADEKGLFFKDGYITSDPEAQYSSISARKIAFLDGGDMFLSKATLNIGRVPVLYFPYFFYPGSRLTGNPAFGLNSTRGMFLSLTYELLGKYPKFSSSEVSSFSALLKESDNGSERSNGLYYEDGLESNSKLAAWAENSKSYITLLADTYEHTGFDVGTDSLLKLFNGHLTFSSNSLLSFSNKKYNDSNKRFYSINELKYTSKYLTLTGLIPFYSDPYVLVDYGNRLTSFSIDSIFGLSQNFPATYSSNITSYTTSIKGKLTVPVKKIWMFDSLEVSSFTLSSKSKWNSRKQEYELTEIVYPEINVKASGTILGISKTKEKQAIIEKVEEEKVYSLSEYFILSDSLLFPLYENERKKRTSGSSSTTTTSSLKLSYTAYEQFTRNYTGRENDEFIGESTVNKVGSTITLDANSQNKFSFTSTLTPSYSYTYYEESNNQKTDILSFNNTNTIKIPKIGFTWYINTQLYRYSKVENNSSETEKTEKFGWDKESVKQHYISFSKSYGKNGFTVTPSIKYIIDPLDGIITPAISLKYKNFTFAADLNIVEDTKENIYRGKTMNVSLGYLGTYLTSSFKAIYDWQDYTSSDIYKPLSFTSSLSLRSKDKAYSITEYLNFDAYDNGVRNEIESLKTYIVTPVLLFTHNFKTINEEFKSDYYEVKFTKSNIARYWWKNRAVFFGDVSAIFHYDYNNPYNIYSSLTTKLTFSIAEFLDINLSLVTKNNGYYRYKQNGDFLKNMYEDLLRSFDFGGSGVNSTQFIMDSVSLEFVHYMKDWDLHCKYTAAVLSSSSGYSWVPTVTFYLKWKTMPDLKVDENWRKRNEVWTSTESVYGK